MKKDRDFREKSDAARRGKGFVGQGGGNETLTPQQIALAEATAIRLRTGLQALQSAGFTSSCPAGLEPATFGYGGFGIWSRTSDVTRSTSRVRGPWTPSTRLSSMSEVAEGPEMNVIGRVVSPAAMCRPATASGTSPTTWSSRMTHR